MSQYLESLSFLSNRVLKTALTQIAWAMIPATLAFSHAKADDFSSEDPISTIPGPGFEGSSIPVAYPRLLSQGLKTEKGIDPQTSPPSTKEDYYDKSNKNVEKLCNKYFSDSALVSVCQAEHSPWAARVCSQFANNNALRLECFNKKQYYHWDVLQDCNYYFGDSLDLRESCILNNSPGFGAELCRDHSSNHSQVLECLDQKLYQTKKTLAACHGAFQDSPQDRDACIKNNTTAYGARYCKEISSYPEQRLACFVQRAYRQSEASVFCPRTLAFANNNKDNLIQECIKNEMSEESAELCLNTSGGDAQLSDCIKNKFYLNPESLIACNKVFTVYNWDARRACILNKTLPYAASLCLNSTQGQTDLLDCYGKKWYMYGELLKNCAPLRGSAAFRPCIQDNNPAGAKLCSKYSLALSSTNGLDCIQEKQYQNPEALRVCDHYFDYRREPRKLCIQLGTTQKAAEFCEKKSIDSEAMICLQKAKLESNELPH